MRKFSWILALMLALSMAFVGCSSGGGDGDGGGGGGGGDATVTLPEGSLTGITVDSALTGYWDGDEENGTLVFTTSGVGTEDAITTNAGAFFFAVKSAVIENVSTVEITGGKVKIKVIITGDDEEMFNYAIADNVLTIKEDDDVKFVGTLRTSSGGGGGGGNGSAPTALTVKVDGADQQVTVIAGNNGTITYSANPSSYTYTYGTVANSGGGNAIVRFKVNLGTLTIGDLSKVSFVWTGVSGDASSYKKIYLLASGDESAITPWKQDSDIKAMIISTPPSGGFHEGDATQVNGTAATNVDLSIVTTDDETLALTGEVWFSIFEMADDGGYTIGDVKFVKK